MENSQEIRTLQLFSSVVASMKQAASLPNQHQQTAGRCTKEANVKNHPEISYLNLTQNIYCLRTKSNYTGLWQLAPESAV